MTRWPPGVDGLDHTADVGIRVRAPSLDALFHRAALGMLALMGVPPDDEHAAEARGAAPADADEPDRVDDEAGTRAVVLDAPDLDALLVAWLREILFLFQVRDFAYMDARFLTLEAERLDAHVRGGPAGAPETELKGVTYHGLAVGRDDDGWTAAVIFDV